ncbi:ABC transporter permease subunit [Faecalicatena sp. AGMB00832]|uniref:ABC transporter permease subunit n=1 Tax=Faecalicatena faecalis TaxID=2726362 RepID=A0ABS6D6Y5_9FIRM|nr:ABC transporter permease subunit [Faecalicatena faecalis]MBU3877206.1 ABC transporter permease subunit [Faecalicatena faecalis]MDY5620280.1 ABC transporter permease subunit [Lachnospiraceae bacterium]
MSQKGGRRLELLKFELKKLAGNRFFWCFCSLLFLLNLWTIRERVRTDFPAAESVRAAYQDFSNVPVQEQEAWLAEKKEKVGREPEYTGNSFAEIELLKGMESEFQQIQKYEEYLDEMQEKADQMTVVIFSNEHTFAYRNARKTPAVFEKLRGLELKAEVSEGVETASRAEFTDLCMLFAVIALSYFLVFQERKNRLNILLRSTSRGRKNLIRAKLQSAAVVTCFLVVLYYGTDFLYGFAKYGFGDLSRPVQSVTMFYESPYRMTVGAYLLVYLLAKFLVCFVISLLTMLLAQSVKSSAGFLAATVGFGVVQYGLTAFLPEHSYLDFFRSVNLAEYIKVYPLVEKYHNLNFFDYPVNAVFIFAVVILITAFGLYAGNQRRFCRTARERAEQEQGGLFQRFRIQKTIVPALPFCELWKLCIGQKAVWLAFLLLGGAVLLSRGRIGEFDFVEDTYRSFLLEQEGRLTVEKMQYFEDKKTEYESIFHMTPESSDLTEDEIRTKQSNAMYTYSGFMKAYQQAEYVQEWNQKNPDKGLPLLYGTGYEILLGEAAPGYTISMILLCVIAAVYAASVTLGGEYDLKVMKLLRSTSRGRLSLLGNKLLTAGLFAVVTAVLIRIPVFLEIEKRYPMNMWNVRIQSISAMSWITGDFSIAEYVLFIQAGQFLGMMIVILAVMALSMWVKDTVMTMVISSVLVIFPLILEWYGFAKIHFFTLNGILETQRLLQSGPAVIICYVVIFVLALPAFCIRQFYKMCRGSR